MTPENQGGKSAPLFITQGASYRRSFIYSTNQFGAAGLEPTKAQGREVFRGPGAGLSPAWWGIENHLLQHRAEGEGIQVPPSCSQPQEVI